MPVHRVVCERGELREVYVAADGEALREELGPVSNPEIEDILSRAGSDAARRTAGRGGLAACRWIEQAGARLGRGFVLTVDYGHEAAELYNERHQRGTVLAYARHTGERGSAARAGRAGFDGAREFHGAGTMRTPRRAGADRPA